MTDGPQQHRRIPRRFNFHIHFIAFVAIIAILTLINFLAGMTGYMFWPVFAWATILSLHYFIASSFDINENWISERVFDLRTRSYDFDHIRDIEKRIGEEDHSVSPQTMRDKEQNQNQNQN